MDIFESFAATQGESRQSRVMCVCVHSEGGTESSRSGARCQPVCRAWRLLLPVPAQPGPGRVPSGMFPTP